MSFCYFCCNLENMNPGLDDIPLLLPEDLPKDWRMPTHMPFDSEKVSRSIDAAICYEKWVDNEPELNRELSAGNKRIEDGRWFLIQHKPTWARVLIRLQRNYDIGIEPMGEVRITGIMYLPEWAGDPVTSPMLRALPTSLIEAAVNRRQFAVTSETKFVDGEVTLPSGRVLKRKDLMKPLGNPKRTSDFYEVVALQHASLVEDGDPNPTETLARFNDVPLVTAQGWVARARRKGLLPPGRRGRAG